MLPSPAFLTIFSFLCCHSNPLLRYHHFDLAAISPKVDVVPGRNSFRTSVPLSPLQSDDFTVLCGTGTKRGVDGTDAVNCFDSFCPHMKNAEREVFQPPPRPCDLVLHTSGLPHRSLPSSPFPSECPPSTRFLPRFPVWFFQHVGCIPTPRLYISFVNPLEYYHVT